MLRTLSGFIVLGCLLGPTVASDHGQDRSIAQLGDRLTKVAGHDGLLAWSEWDADSERYSLIIKPEGEDPRRVDVPGRRLPFDVDVGPDREGRPALVYSRCRREPDTSDPRGAEASGTGLLNYSATSGCDIYLYSPAEDEERELDDMSMESASEFLPSLWKGNVAFARRYSPRGEARLYLNRRDGSRSRRLGAGPVAADDGPASLDLRGDRLAYHWINLVDGCDDADIDSSGPFEEHIRLVAPSDKPFDLAVSCQSESRSVSVAGPSWAGSTLVYVTESTVRNEVGDGPRTGEVIARRSSDGQRRTLGTYTVDGALAYTAVGPDAIFGAFRAPPDGSRIDRLSPTP